MSGTVVGRRTLSVKNISSLEMFLRDKSTLSDFVGFLRVLPFPPTRNVGITQLGSLTYKRTGLLDRLEKAWSQDGGNMRVFAHEVTS